MMKQTLLQVLLVSSFGLVMSENIKCGPKFCVDLEGVTCSDDNKCLCPPGTEGDATVTCFDPDEHVACIIRGNVDVLDYSSKEFDLPLPCAHSVSNLATPSGCEVDIRAVASYVQPGSLAFGAKIRTVHVKVKVGKQTFTVIFHQDGHPIMEYSLPGDKGILPQEQYSEKNITGSLDAAGFYSIRVQKCGLNLIYKPGTKVFGLVVPPGTKGYGGLCGENLGSTTNINAQKALARNLASLNRYSPVDGEHMNTDNTCKTLTQDVEDCPEDRRDFAEKYCGKMILKGPVRKCSVEQAGGNEALLERFSDCYSAVCSGVGVCDSYKGYFEVCALDHYSKYSKKLGFCE